MKIREVFTLAICIFGAAACSTARYGLPRGLVDGDLVGVLGVSSRSYPENTDTAYVRGELSKIGFRTLFSDHLLDQNDPSFGASDSVRAAELNKMMCNDSVRAILFYRGGYGAVRMLDGIDWRVVRQKRKWMAGYSDITMIHLAAAARGVSTIHSDMPVSFDRPTAHDSISPSLRSLSDALRGKTRSVDVVPHALNQSGVATGRIVGGNLSLVYASSGTKEDRALRRRGYVLFIEEVGEKLYHVDRMMQNLERSGKLARASAIVVGHMTDIKYLDRFGVASAEELVARYTSRYKIPVIFGMPSGHDRPNLSIYMGCSVRVVVGDTIARVDFLINN